MDILNAKTLRQKADSSLRRGREPKKLIYGYAGISLALSLGMFLAELWLDRQIAGTGGLGGLGTRAILSTVQLALPMLVGVVSLCLDFGFLAGLLRISRGQYADYTDLKVGFQRFGALMRLTLLQVLLCMGVSFLPVLLPCLFRIRMAYYCLLDDPRGSAMEALRESNRLMRHRFGQMLKIDLRLWLYYAAMSVSALVIWADAILVLLGIPFPMEAELFADVLFGISLLVQTLTQIFLRPAAEVTYMTAYDALREKKADSGVVLGNIFDM